MDEAFHHSPHIPASLLTQLQARTNGPATFRLTVQWVGIGLSASGVLLLPAWGWAGALLLGSLLASLFAPLHECVHRTAFVSRQTNDRVLLGLGILLLTSPTAFRALHFTHHRHTHDPALDPEISAAPRFLGQWSSPWVWVARVMGLPFLMMKLVGLSSLAASPPESFWLKQVPYIPSRDRRRVVWESRGILLIWGGIGVVATRVPGMTWWFVAQGIAHVLLMLWLSAEHTGLPHQGSILARTRSIDTSAFIRFFTWNMTLHAEHHAWPGVPFHQLPRLRTEMEGELLNRTPGFLRFHVSVWRGLLRGWRVD